MNEMSDQEQRRKNYQGMSKDELIDALMAADYQADSHSDTSEQVQAMEEPAKMEPLLELILNNMPSGIRYVDSNNKILLFNSMYSKLWDLPDGVVKIGSDIRDENLLMAKRGDYGEGDPEDLVDGVMHALPFHTEPQQYERVSPSGRKLGCRTQPVSSGGYISVYTDITERKVAEQKLSETLNVLQTVIDNVPGGIRYVDKERKIVTLNQEYRDLWKLPESVAKVGNTDRDLLVFMVDRGDYGEGDKEELINSVAYALQFDTEPQHYERTTADGRQLECFTKPLVEGGYISIYTDITQRKRAEVELMEARTQLIDAIESISEGFAIYDPDNLLVVCNSKYRELYGYSEEEAKSGVSLSELFEIDVKRGTFEAYLHEEETLDHNVDEHVTGLKDLLVQFADGRWIHMHDRPTSTGGTVTIHTDITERKRAEAELVAKNDILETVMANTEHAISMFDKDRNLIIANDQASDLLLIPSELLEPGTPFKVILRTMAAQGNLGEGDTDTVVESVYERFNTLENMHYERKQSDGKILEVRSQRLKDGGVVNTHTDITERKRAEAELVEKEALLRLICSGSDLI